MDHVAWTAEPRLRRPIMVCAFAGWNDAGEAATEAMRFLIETWNARQFATIDPEEFCDFSSVRPQVQLVNGVTRRIVWPTVDIYAATVPGSAHDAVLVYGVEPQLRWRTFAQQIMGVANRLGVENVVTLGALLADVPHTRPVSVMGTATDAGVIERFGLQRSQYEGPTGILGVINDAATTNEMPAVSLWAAVPTYAHATRSPKAALALVERSARLLGTVIHTEDLLEAAAQYVSDVDEAVADDDDLTAFVQRLESIADEPEVTYVGQEPSAEELVAEVERFLRDHGGDD